MYMYIYIYPKSHLGLLTKNRLAREKQFINTHIYLIYTWEEL